MQWEAVSICEFSPNISGSVPGNYRIVTKYKSDLSHWGMSDYNNDC